MSVADGIALLVRLRQAKSMARTLISRYAPRATADSPRVRFPSRRAASPNVCPARSHAPESATTNSTAHGSPCRVPPTDGRTGCKPCPF
jgi:hypothetical protein